ncbi:aquaporin AQPcic-like [Gossypium australe]|uniref:Aquaporin AQPcic-like n=1 Tax=Gossypium australe TaxID=47621 RepID=A0A5B6V985_9ROSI|nr:aquaporin AQPcic-like [Gossypium australe]
MARNGIVEDEENNFTHNRVLPVASTPTPGQIKEESDAKVFLSTKVLGLGELLSLESFIGRASWDSSAGFCVGHHSYLHIADRNKDTQPCNVGPNRLCRCSHINPIVTFAALLTGLISISKAAIYILAQCVGGILGSLALKAVVNSAIERTYSLSGCTVTIVVPGTDGPTVIGMGNSQALWLEIICSFVFLFASVWMAFDRRQTKALGRVIICIILGVVLGLLVFILTTVTATKGYGGAGLNPARCFGPAVVRGGHLWNGHWIFWIGPTIGCVAFALYVKMIPREHTHSY